MDFHSLTRRELQCLCKKNKIPANLTNLAMADSLTALLHVEGLEELMNPSESDVLLSPARVSASIPGTGSRTSARRKPTREVEISQPLTQARVARRTAGKRGEENKDVNVPKTPAIPSSRRKAPADSACRSLESQMEEGEEEGKNVGQEKSGMPSGMPKTPSATASRRRAPAAASVSVQRAYSTRRSVKLLETTMAELSLNEGEKSKNVKIDLSKDVDQDLDESSKDNSEVVKIDLSKDVDQDLDESSKDNSEVVKIDLSKDVDQDLDESSKDNSEVVPEAAFLEIEEDSNGSDMHTLEETENISVSDETQDKNEVCLPDIPEKDKKVAEEVPVTEFSSEVNMEAAEVLDGNQQTKDLVKEESVESNQLILCTSTNQGESEFSSEVNMEAAEVLDGNQQTKDLVKEESVESNQLTLCTSTNQGENSYEVCENQVGSDSDINVVEDDEQYEQEAETEYVHEAKDGSKVASENPSDEIEHSLGFPDDMEDSDTESECTSDEEKVGNGSKVENQNPSDEVELSTGDPESKHVNEEVKSDMVSDEKQFEEANNAPVLPKEVIDFQFDFEMEGSDSENINDGLFDVNVAEADAFEKNKSPRCNQAPEQTSDQVEVNVMEVAEFSASTVSSSVKLSGYPITGETPLKPLADDASFAYQFPRPTQTTPMKSSCKKQTTAQKMPLLSDDKENAENSKKADDLNNFSLRELKKRVKALTLNQNGGQKKTALAQQGGKMREPLQSLPDNQMMAVAGQGGEDI